MNENVSDLATINALKIVEQTILDVEEQIIDEFGQGMIRDRLAFNEDRTEGRILAPLVNEEDRPIDTFELARRWREAIPEISGMKSFTVVDDVNGEGDDGEFGYLLFGPDIDTLNAAGLKFIEMLQRACLTLARPSTHQAKKYK